MTTITKIEYYYFLTQDETQTIESFGKTPKEAYKKAINIYPTTTKRYATLSQYARSENPRWKLLK